MKKLTIIGAGRIGTALSKLEPTANLIHRGMSWSNATGPILVCTRNKDLEDIINKTPSDRRQNLIFIQNGMIHSLLDKHGLTDNTQCQFYFAVKSIGAPIEDGGGTALMGHWANELSELLERGSVKSSILTTASYRNVMAEKFLWICVNGVLCSAFNLSVGELVQQKRREIDTLCHEFQPILESELDITLKDGVSERLVAYSKQIPDFFTGLKEWPWRNGWIWERKQTPLHKQLLPASFLQ